MMMCQGSPVRLSGAGLLAGTEPGSPPVVPSGDDLPECAEFRLLESWNGRRELMRRYEARLRSARCSAKAMVLDTVTIRANPDWGRRLGYDLDRLAAVNGAAVALASTFRARWQHQAGHMVINGVIGARGELQLGRRMDAGEAEAYHAFQVEALARAKVDRVTARAVDHVDEAIGIAWAAEAFAVPCVISFRLEADGRLASGQSLREAVSLVDAATGGSPLSYATDCLNPLRGMATRDEGASWLDRIGREATVPGAGQRGNNHGRPSLATDRLTIERLSTGPGSWLVPVAWTMPWREAQSAAGSARHC